MRATGMQGRRRGTDAPANQRVAWRFIGEQHLSALPSSVLFFCQTVDGCAGAVSRVAGEIQAGV